MSRLEQAAIEVELALWHQIGPTADWPIKIDDEKVIKALTELDAAVLEVAEKFGYSIDD